MPILVEPTTSAAELFLSVAGGDAYAVPNLDELKRTLVTRHDEYAVMLGPGVDMAAAAALADTLRITRPGLSVILIRRRVDTSVLAEALRSGMREVVEERDLAALGEAIKRARQVYEAVNTGAGAHSDRPVGKLITVFSPKGGVGKTTLAVNLGIALAKSARVCVVDLDLGFGDIAITLQLFPGRTMADLVSMENDLDFQTLETMLTSYKDGMSILVAPVRPDEKDSISPVLVGRVLTLLKQNFDFVVVDTSPGFDEHVLQAFDETDELLLVTTLDVPTLKNVKIAAETLDLLNFPKAARKLILNRADDKVGLSAEKVEATLDMKIASAIPTSSDVANATNMGEPIVASAPRHPVSNALQALTSQLSGQAVSAASAVAKPEATREAGSHRRSLLRRK